MALEQPTLPYQGSEKKPLGSASSYVVRPDRRPTRRQRGGGNKAEHRYAAQAQAIQLVPVAPPHNAALNAAQLSDRHLHAQCGHTRVCIRSAQLQQLINNSRHK